MNDVEEPKQYVVERVRQALASDERVHELSLEVKVAGHRVFVSGCVPTAERREAVAAVIAELLPGYDVANQTEVAGHSEPGEAEELS